MSEERARDGLQNRTVESRKAIYATPRLTEFGALHRVTRGSRVVGADEGPMGMNAASERSLKENIVRIDTHPLGFGLYLFDYKPEHRSTYGHGRQFGVMADEVEVIVSDAVSIGPGGHKWVDYRKLGITQHSRQLH